MLKRILAKEVAADYTRHIHELSPVVQSAHILIFLGKNSPSRDPTGHSDTFAHYMLHNGALDLVVRSRCLWVFSTAFLMLPLGWNVTTRRAVIATGSRVLGFLPGR